MAKRRSRSQRGPSKRAGVRRVADIPSDSDLSDSNAGFELAESDETGGPLGLESAESDASRDGRDRERAKKRRKKRSKKSFAVHYLPEPGGAPPRDPVTREVRHIVGQLRQKCGACGFRRLCAFAPVKLQIDRRKDKRLPHRHQKLLRQGLKQLSRVEGDWEPALIGMLAGSEKDALLAGCLVYELWRKRPEKVRHLVDYTAQRCDVDGLKAEVADIGSEDSTRLQPGQGIDPDRLLTRQFRSQVLRMISFFRKSDSLALLQDLLVLDSDDDGRLVQSEAVAVLSLLIGRKMSPDKWIGSLEKDASGPFRATFAYRSPGHGGLDLFFPYRRGKRRSYLYYRRNPEGQARLSSVDKVRVDSLLHRMFLVFEGDSMKTHRVFKELCRHVNVRAGEYNANHVLAGFERLDRDDLLLLGVYAPALARAVGHFLGIEDYHLLIKLLYELRSQSGRRGEPKASAHEKVVQARDRWNDLIHELGADVIKSVFSVLFRLNASYLKRIYTTPTYLKIGEVAYLLTALAGWNPKGLEIELKQSRKALAFVAYGLQPPGRWSKIRVGKIRRAYERLLDRENEEGELERACEQGMRYMGALHGYASFDAFEAAAASVDWEPPAPESTRLPMHIEADEEDFSEFADHESFEDVLEEESDDLSEEDVMVVIDDDSFDDEGRLRTQRMPKGGRRHRDSDDYYEDRDEDEDD
jgi:hypothetical protein